MPELSQATVQFIIHWGEMSSRWGINRSMAQIHALLYLSDHPLNAEQIATTLSLARSNVSGNLRELQAWGIIRVVHLLGDRCDYFQAMSDAWGLLTTILEQRKRREIDPTIEMLRECVKEDRKSQTEDDTTRQRMRELLQVLESVTAWYEQMINLPRSAQKTVLKLGSKLKLIEGLSRDPSSPVDDHDPRPQEEA